MTDRYCKIAHIRFIQNGMRGAASRLLACHIAPNARNVIGGMTIYWHQCRQQSVGVGVSVCVFV